MEEQETIEPENGKEMKLKKEYEWIEENKKYKLKIELNINEIIFELNLISEISYYTYIKKYKYNEIRKDLNLSYYKYNDITKIYNYFDIKTYKIIDENRNKKIIINDKDIILLYENENKNIINILINEINKMKEINNKQNEKINELIKINENQDNKINNLETNYNNLKEELKLINDIIYKKGNVINLIYECEYEGNHNIFGKQFVENNKNNIDLIINGKKNNLTSKYKLKKGENNIKLIIKNKITNLSYMFYECKTLKHNDELKYLNTSNCNNFSYMLYGCSSLADIKSLENWNVSNGNNFRSMFYRCSSLTDIKSLEKWKLSKYQFDSLK